MKNVKYYIVNNPIVRTMASVKLTGICLVLLFILVFWGTIAQVEQGLYAAQERFFFSWGFLAGGFIPFPSAHLVLWVLFINLLLNVFSRFVYTWDKVGIVIIHLGLLTYFVAAFALFHLTHESNVALYEGEETNVSVDYGLWEISVWQQRREPLQHIYAVDVGPRIKGEVVIPSLDAQLTIKKFFDNARVVHQGGSASSVPLNASGITEVEARERNKEREKNVAAVFLNVNDQEVLLFGAESKPTYVTIENRKIAFQLRKRRYELPFTIKLIDFRKEMHPNTEIAKKYESLVVMKRQGLEREQLIYMNHPLRHKDYTLYQASYTIDQWGREQSILAVVENKGKLSPYIASSITLLGLITHFLGSAFKRRKDENV